MSKAILAESLLKTRTAAIRTHNETSLAGKIAFAFGAACLTGLAAQLKVYLPWTPVPVTGQTLAVLLCGILMGKWWGGLSQAIYVAVGVAGVPWFSGWSGGAQALIGPTGGYLFGFVIAALFLGYFSNKYYRAKCRIPVGALLFFADFVLIYIPGLIILGTYYYVIRGSAPSVVELIELGFLPFVLGDIIKILAATSIARLFLPSIKRG